MGRGKGSTASDILYGKTAPRTSQAELDALEIPEAWIELGQRLNHGYHELKKLSQQASPSSGQRLRLVVKMQGIDIALDLYKNAKERYQESYESRWEFFTETLTAAAEAEEDPNRREGILLSLDYQRGIPLN